MPSLIGSCGMAFHLARSELTARLSSQPRSPLGGLLGTVGKSEWVRLSGRLAS